jgi:hypothetical protein
MLNATRSTIAPFGPGCKRFTVLHPGWGRSGALVFTVGFARASLAPFASPDMRARAMVRRLLRGMCFLW